MKNKDLDFETKAIHVGQDPDPVTGAVIPPIYTTSTYAQESPGEHKGYDYSRTSNPTRHAFEVCVASLEEGEKAHAFSSGVAAISACVELLQPGDHIIAMDDLYGGTVRLFNEIKSISQGIEISYVDMSKEDNIEASIKPNTKMLFAETPTNPLLKIIDLEKLADFARSKNIITVADNTFCSPYIQRPLTKGFDYVIHSATKYLCGHSDVIMGVLVMKDAETDNSKRLSNIHNSLGPISSPFDSYLALRSLKTLALRMERHSSNAKKIADFLESHPKISNVIYPGLESHPQHSVAKKQMDFFGGMISVEIKDGLKASKNFLEKTSLFTLAESLGGVESLIEHPALMTHASISKEVRDQIGITDGLVRLSVGIESADDLINDLDKALN